MDYLRQGYADLTWTFSYTCAQIQQYFWHILFGAILLTCISKKFLVPALEKLYGRYEDYKKRKEDSEYAAKYDKNPDIFSARISAQQAAAQKLQEKYEIELRQHQEKLKEKEARKREAVRNLLSESDKGHTFGNGNKDAQSKSFRPEYHPLMGPGSSSNYRPPKKSKCGGGGCGK